MGKEDGGPAFPVEGVSFLGSTVISSTGLSVRDWFAGQALAALVDRWVGMPGGPLALGAEAYKLADAMLAARTRDGGSGNG
jgi:hypothetical protein